MATIALLTDFGERDGFVGMMKGVILGIAPGCDIIDVTHHIESFNIKAGAFVLQRTARHFPTGTIFVAVVDPGVGSERRILAAHAGDYYFIAPDNGILSYVFSDYEEREIVSVDNSMYFREVVSATFQGRDIMAPVAAHLANGVNMTELGTATASHHVMPMPNLLRYRRGVMGEIVYVDKFGNMISNIARSDLPRDVEISQMHCIIGDAKRIKFVDHYTAGEGLSAIISGFDTVEVFVRLGSAAERFAQPVGATIAVEA